MNAALRAMHSARSVDWQWMLAYGALLPLSMASEGAKQIYYRVFVGADGARPPRGAWSAQARSQASIAATYVLMAKSMLRSSERRTRPERPLRS